MEVDEQPTGERRRPPIKQLDFGQVSERKRPAASATTVVITEPHTWPSDGPASPHLEFIRSHSSGRLKFSPCQVYDFTAHDLDDMGEIGQGAFGTVNRMLHRATSTVMAVKRIRSTVDEKEQKQLLMDLDVIMRSDDCPYIVKFYGAIFREGDCWICMEIMDTSLEKLYKFVFEKLNETVPEAIIGKIAAATLRALAYLKDHLRIIHRDVKPSNILLDRRGHIKLCDFGIAGQLVDSIAKTRDAGCRPYMAPERLSLSTVKYDVRSDVWSLGITLAEVAVGRFPFPAWNSVFDQLQQVVHGDPPILAPSDRFSFEFVSFVNSCLIKEEEHRPKYKQLLDSRFIRRAEAEAEDVAGYVSRILDAGVDQRRENWVTFENGPSG